MLFSPFFDVVVDRQFGVVFFGRDFSFSSLFGPGMVSQSAFWKCSDSLAYLSVVTVVCVVIWLTGVIVDRVHGVVIWDTCSSVLVTVDWVITNRSQVVVSWHACSSVLSTVVEFNVDRLQGVVSWLSWSSVLATAAGVIVDRLHGVVSWRTW